MLASHQDDLADDNTAINTSHDFTWMVNGTRSREPIAIVDEVKHVMEKVKEGEITYVAKPYE